MSLPKTALKGRRAASLRVESTLPARAPPVANSDALASFAIIDCENQL